MRLNRSRNCEFPSPFGDLYISTDMKQRKVMDVMLFPSPSGELFISTKRKKGNMGLRSVSVPFRGSLSINNGKAYLKERIKGFRPLPGISIYQL